MPNIASKISEQYRHAAFFEQLIYQVLDGKRDPLSFSDCQFLLGEAAASFTRNELAHALRKGPFQADKPCQESKKWEFMLLLLVTPPEESIIWFGMEFVIAEDTDTCYLHMSYVCISLQCFDLTMEDIMDHIPYFLITACSTAPLIYLKHFANW